MNAQQQPSGQAGRYQRSPGGLIISLVVTVGAIGGLLYFMGVFRHDFEVKPENVEYLALVESLQQAGGQPVYPAVLPEGWLATSVEADPEGEPIFRIGLLTEDEDFVGVVQQDASAMTLVNRWVDEDAEPAEGYTATSSTSVASSWKGYSDNGGDHGLVAEVDGVRVLVFGSAPVKQLRQVVDSLTTAAVD